MIPAALFPVVSNIDPLPVLGVNVVRVSITPGVSAIPPAFSAGFYSKAGALEVRRDFQLTAAQWDAWDNTVTDAEYILTCAATNLGFTVAA